MTTSEFNSIEKSIENITTQHEIEFNSATEKWIERNDKFILEGALNEYRNKLLSSMKDASFQMLINEESTDTFGINAEKYVRNAKQLLFSYSYTSEL